MSRPRGQPRRAGDQPIIRVEIRFGESEVAEIDAARGKVDRSTAIRDAVLAWARSRGRAGS